MTHEVRLLRHDERRPAAAVAARALRDDPMFVYLYGTDPVVRMGAAYSSFREPPAPATPWWDRVRGRMPAAPPPPTVWGAVVQGHVVAGAAVAAPGSCFVDLLPPATTRLPGGPEGPPGSPDRQARVLATLAAHHCPDRHWHVGPVGVEPGLQGRGVGSAVMRLLCDAMDEAGEIAFLETETPENVVFYRRLGFEVTGEAQLPGLPLWFMRRDPR
ncbi:MAG: GNAT family N-acetyltransferase [Actinobacteria bacterium]|nr:GNAT family N-acetyltransferase [Actinomycetota bacterium]